MSVQLEKFAKMKRVARGLKDEGVPIAERREAILVSEASGNSWDEAPGVIEAMLRKYWQIEVVDSSKHVVVVVPHWREPGSWEAAIEMKKQGMFPDEEVGELAEKYKKWLKKVDSWSEELDKAGGLPGEGLDEETTAKFQAFRKEHGFDPRTEEMVKEDTNRMVAKKRRERGDANRRAFSRDDQTVVVKVGGREYRIEQREFGTGARMALYYGLVRVAVEMGILGEDGRLTEDLMVVFVHGMVNSRAPQDLVLGGGSRTYRKKSGEKAGREVELMDPRLLRWIPEKLVKLAGNMGIEIEDKSLRVGVHVLGRKDLAIYQMKEKEVRVEMVDRNTVPDGKGGVKPVKRFAATVLEELRKGFKKKVEGVRVGKGGRLERFEKTMTMRGLGPRLQLVQLEVTENLRSNKDLLGKLRELIEGLQDGFVRDEWKDEASLMPDPWGR